MSATSISIVPLPEAPFRGLESLRFVDKAIFAGRKEETGTLLSKLTLYRAVALYGETGTGKSSLINAGVLPKVLAENYVADRIRVQPFPNREIKIERIHFSDDESAGYLPSNFLPESENGESELRRAGFELSLPAFKRQVRKMRVSRRPGTDRSLDMQQRPKRALLIFDQFEEVITLFQDAQRNANSSEGYDAQVYAARAQRAILINIIRMIRDQRLPIKILLTFREDYLAKLRLFFDHCPEVLSQAQRLVLPRASSLPNIIRAPFAREDLRAHFVGKRPEARSEINPALAQEIANQLTESSGPDTAILTELQIVCRRLWQSSDPNLLFENKRIHGLIRDYLIEVFRHFPEELRDPAIVLLAKMLTNSNTRNIVSEDDLVDRTSGREHISRETLIQALNLLAETRIVRREARGSLHVYEITSEYLVPWIKERVSERKALAFQKKARERTRRFVVQRRRTRLLQRLVAILGALLLGLVALTAVAGYQSKKLVQAKREQLAAEQSEMAAEARFAEAQRQKDRYEAATKVIAGKDDETKLKAIAKIDQWTREKDFPPELTVLLVVAQSKTDSPLVKDALAKVLQTDPAILASAERDEGLALPPQFQINIADDSQRPLAQKLAAALREQGWVVPSVQAGSGDSPYWDNELRFFRKAEEIVPPVPEILSVLGKTTRGKWVDKYVPGYANSPKVRSGYFEIWFAAPTGKLYVSFLDDGGKTVRGLRVTLRFVPSHGIGVQFSRSRKGPGFIDVPPGIYDVTISVPGYQDMLLNLSIEADQQVKWSDLKLTK